MLNNPVMKKITFLLFTILPLIGFSQLIVVNPTFDSDVSGWSFNGNESGGIVWESLDGNTTIGSLELTAAAVNDRAQFTSGVTPLLGNYLVSAWVKGAAGTQFQLAIFQGASGNNEFSGVFTIDVADDSIWKQYQFTASSLNDVSTRLRLLAKSAGTFYFDDIEITQIISERNLYSFDTDDDAEAWDERGGTYTGPTSGVLTFTPDTDQFAKLVQEGYFIDAAANSHLRIVMQNLSTNDDQFRVIAPGGGNATLAITTSDATEQTYEIDLSGLAGWTGNVTELELGFRDADNAAGAGRSSGTGDFLINSIEFFTPALPYIVSVADGSWSDSATWAGGVLPTAIDDVKIDHEVIINGDREANDVVVSASGSLLINKSFNSLHVYGDFTNNATEDKVVLRADSDQFSSIIVDGTATGAIRFRRFVNSGPDNDLISPPVTISSFADFYGDNSSFFIEDSGSDEVLFGPFDNSAAVNAYVNFESTNTDALIQGKGYRMGTTGLAAGSALSFHGTIETGNVDISITSPAGGSPWNLIGNPYSSYLSFKDFFDVLTDYDGSVVGANNQLDSGFTAVYGYDTDETDPSGSHWTIWDFNNATYATDNITPGQGFFVRSKSSGGTASFTPSMRTIGDSDDFIAGRSSSSNIAMTRLFLTNSTNSYTTNIYFRDFNTLGLDPGYDTGAYGQSGLGIYSLLVEDNNDILMANQSLPYANLNDITVPLVVNSNQGVQFTIGIDAIVSNIPSNINIYLDDNVLNTSTLLNSGDYTITPGSNLSGAGRFYLRLADSALSINGNELENLRIYTLKETIVVSGELTSETVFKMYDVQGRLINKYNLNQANLKQVIDVSNLHNGIYVVTLEGVEGSISQKIIVNN